MLYYYFYFLVLICFVQWNLIQIGIEREVCNDKYSALIKPSINSNLFKLYGRNNENLSLLNDD